jgi:hypothetical protein
VHQIREVLRLRGEGIRSAERLAGWTARPSAVTWLLRKPEGLTRLTARAS